MGDTLRCVITFDNGKQLYKEVSYIDAIYEYINDWFNAGKTKVSEKDIRNIKLLDDGETPHKSVYTHIKEL